jgi:hypothetical protein
MPSQNQLDQLRKAFQIPDAVVIRALPIQKILHSNVGSQQQNFTIDQTTNIDPVLYQSPLGTPVYCNIEFLTDSYETNVKGQFRDTPRLVYEAVLITVSQAKKIIRTEIQGRNGTVKEYIGQDDYQVQINGIITGPNGHYPVDEVAFLKQMLDAPIPIPVVSTYLNNLGINLLVVDSYELAQEAGGYSYQTFSISCLSDIPQELRLTNV